MTPRSTLSHLFGLRAFEMEEQLRQATHLVNPSSGIANDFLNQYNEILASFKKRVGSGVRL